MFIFFVFTNNCFIIIIFLKVSKVELTRKILNVKCLSLKWEYNIILQNHYAINFIVLFYYKSVKKKIVLCIPLVVQLNITY